MASDGLSNCMTSTSTMATPFTPKDNPAFILHGKLDTSYGTVSPRGS